MSTRNCNKTRLLKRNPLINLSKKQTELLLKQLDSFAFAFGFGALTGDQSFVDEQVAQHKSVVNALAVLGIEIKGHEPRGGAK